jgi:D-glycero-D-manno-heptose 1,7-bisphosphate phosphatase
MLDRDGVINVDNHYVHKIGDWEWTPGAPEAMRELRNAGYQLVIVTNQSGVGRGMHTAADYFDLMTEVRSDYYWHHFYNGHPGESKSFPTWTAHCFHKPEDRCKCRKPKTGLWATDIAPAYNVVKEASWFLDDKETNLDFGREIGVNLALIGEGKECADDTVTIFDSLHQFAEALLKKEIPWTQVTVAGTIHA